MSYEQKFFRFFLNNFFEYENCACVCQKETVYSVPGQPPSYNLKLCSVPEQPLRFSYAAQKGLNLSGNAGGIISENILGQLLALPSDDIDEIIHFLEKYVSFFQSAMKSMSQLTIILCLLL